MEKRKEHETTKSGYGSSNRSTFVIKVDHCQNNTWQGRITWAEENKQVTFRSTLELLKLMDEAVEKTQKANKSNDKTSAS